MDGFHGSPITSRLRSLWRC